VFQKGVRRKTANHGAAIFVDVDAGGGKGGNIKKGGDGKKSKSPLCEKKKSKAGQYPKSQPTSPLRRKNKKGHGKGGRETGG